VLDEITAALVEIDLVLLHGVRSITEEVGASATERVTKKMFSEMNGGEVESCAAQETIRALISSTCPAVGFSVFHGPLRVLHGATKQ
jgi:hypothetical protein